MKLKNDNQKTSPTIAVRLIYFSQFVLFWGDGCRAIEADHILYYISIEPLLMDEQDDGKQKCKRPHSSDDVMMTWAVRIVWSQHGFHFICKMRLIWKEIQILISNQLCVSNIVDQVSVQQVKYLLGFPVRDVKILLGGCKQEEEQDGQKQTSDSLWDFVRVLGLRVGGKLK